MSEKNAFAVALAKAQSEMQNAVFNRENPHFHSKYADLGAVREATITALTSNGFSINQTTEITPDGFTVLKTELLHDSGENRISRSLITGASEQQQGSSRTYKRRYDWAGICGIAAEEDDDANEASRERGTPKSKAQARGDYEVLETSMRECQTQAELKVWRKANATAIEALPVDWAVTLGQDYRRTLAGLPE